MITKISDPADIRQHSTAVRTTLLASLLLTTIMSGCGEDDDARERSNAASTTSTSGETSATGSTTDSTGSMTSSTPATTGSSTTTDLNCDDDIGCSVGEICVEMLCRMGCRDDNACGQNELCLQETCIARGDGCREDDDCADADYCDLSAERCREDGGCRVDPGEPNENLAEATLIENQMERQEALYLCEGDNDYYSINAEIDETINVQLTFLHDDGDLALQLLDDRGQPLARQNTSGDVETISYRAQYTGLFYIRIFGTESATSNRYELFTSRSPGGTTPQQCEDSFEPNESATEVEVVRSRSYELTLCDDDDEDWFAVNLPPAATIDLRTNSTSTNVVLTFYDRDGVTILGRSARGERQQALEGIGTTLAGLYYVQITSDNVPAVGLDYTLTLSINGATIDPACEDRFEPNEARIGATPIEQGRYSELTLCDTDQDYYQIDLTAQDKLFVTVLFDDEVANVDMEVFDELGERLTGSTSTTNNEEISLIAPTSGNYVIRVHHIEGLTSSYELLVYLEEGPEAPECTDLYDGNHTLATSALLPQEGAVNGRVCPNTPDFFTVTSETPGTYLDLDLDVDVSFGVVYAELLPPFCSAPCQPITTLIAGTAAQSILLEDAGDYHIKIALERGETTTYTLITQVTPPPPCDLDLLEPNDTSDAPTPFSGDISENLVACVDDEDWFLIEIEPNTRLTYTLSIPQPLGEVALDLFELDGTTLRSSRRTIFADIAFSEVIIEGGSYLARVALLDGFNTRYDFSIEREDLSGCFDRYEDNNTSASSTSLEPGSYQDLTLCSTIDEDDFYAISLVAYDTITIDLLFSHDDSDLDLAFLNTNGISTLRRSSGSFDNEQITYTVTRTGTFFIRAYHFGLSGGLAPYELNINVEPFDAPACDEDSYEENDDADNATLIGVGDYPGSACFNDSDWFAVVVPPGRYLTTSLGFLHDDGNLNLEIVDADGVTVLFESSTTTDNETLSWFVEEETTLYVHVYAVGAAVNIYNLNIAFNDEPAVTECRDRLEPNNWSLAPRTITPGNYPDLSICTNADYYDWFAVQVEEGQQLEAEIIFSHAINNLELRAYDVDRVSQLAASNTSNDREVISFPAPRSGLYLLRIRGTSATPTNYELNVNVTPYTPPECVEDSQEDDDNALNANFVSTGEFDGQLCFADPDWYTFAADAGQRATVILNFNNTMGNLNFRILDTDVLTEIGHARSTFSSSETLTRTLTNSGAYYIEVYGMGDAQNSYSLDITIRDP